MTDKFIIIKQDGTKVESDPRRQIKKRMQELWWEANAGIESKLARFLRKLGGEEEIEWNKSMAFKGWDRRKRELIAAGREKMGLRSEYGEAAACRLCQQCRKCDGSEKITERHIADIRAEHYAEYTKKFFSSIPIVQPYYQRDVPGKMVTRNQACHDCRESIDHVLDAKPFCVDNFGYGRCP